MSFFTSSSLQCLECLQCLQVQTVKTQALEALCAVRCARQILDSLLSIQPRLGAALAWSFWSVRFASRLRRRRMMKAVLETENCFEL